MALSVKSELIAGEGGHWEMTLVGEVDVASASVLRNALAEAYLNTPSDIYINAEELSYIDSTGLGVIIGAFGRMKENSHRIVIEKPRSNVKKLLNITSLDKILC